MAETMLSVIGTENREVSRTVYDRIDPMEFVNTFGKVFAMTGAGGCKTESDGKLMALACLSEKKMIFDIARRYHLMDGKLVTKSETMLSDFRKAGGDVTWLKTGSDCIEAHLKLELNGKVADYAFNIATAQKAGYIRKGSNWEKRPDQQLRARCITDLMHMQWPELCNGDYTAEEVEDFSNSVQVVGTSAKSNGNGSGGSSKPVSSTAKVYDAKPAMPVVDNGPEVSSTKSPEKTVENTVENTTETTTEQIIDVESQPAEKPPFDVESSAETKGDADESGLPSAADSTFTANVMEIQTLIPLCGWNESDILQKFNGKYGTDHADFGGFTEEQQATILGNIRKVYDKFQAEQLAKK